MLKMDCQKDTTHNIRHKKHAIKNKTDKNWEKNWNKKNLVVNLLELIRVKKAMIETMKVIEYKHLSVNLKTEN